MNTERGRQAESSVHSAAEAALGYLYQAKWALLELLRGSAARPEAAISLELYDDVAWDETGSPTELLQLKHHVSSVRNLTDRSPDLWRTIELWLDAGPPSDPDGPTLTLITTQIAAQGTAVAAMRPDASYNLGEAIRLLEAAAQHSDAASTRAVRERFLSLGSEERAQFVGRMRVLDGAPVVGELDDLVRKALLFALPVGHEGAFLDRLWGWWFRRVLDMLRGQAKSVTGFGLRVFIDDLHSEFVQDNLPTFDDLHLSESDVPEFDDRPFVHQLRWVVAPDAILRRAVLDYYRAYAHTARWLEEDLIGIEELEQFETRLVEEWEMAFAWLLQDLPAEPTEEQKQQAGRRLLRRTLDQTAIRVRERYSEPFFTRGKHHGLADEGQIGWHPEFEKRLEELLLSRPA